MNAEFWKRRRVFVTGHTGFKGGWLSLWLERLRSEVTGFALPPPTTPSLFESAHVGSGLTSLIGDIRDRPALETALAGARPEIVFHMAAQPIVRESYSDPVGTYGTNVMGTVHLLEAARHVPSIRAIVVVTTDKVYDNREWAWGYRETDALGGRDPYSNSKACAEMVTHAYRASFFAEASAAKIATARAGNVIGGGDWAKDRLIRDVITAFADGQPVVIRNPIASRPWQHVLDPLSGYLTLAEQLVEAKMPVADAWNFGPQEGSAHPVSWIVERLAERWGSGRWELASGPQPHEAQQLKLDISKAGAQLRWAPRLSLGDALDWTVEWYRAYLTDHSSPRATTTAQIERYMEAGQSVAS
jgi:CDP-glucose 4,6-dehydratase